MGNILYIVATVLAVLWAIAYFGFDASQIVHVLIIIAVIAVLAKIFSGNKIIR